MRRGQNGKYETVEQCGCEGRQKESVVADLEGTLTRSKSSFPYFMLVALEAGSLFRAVILLIASPFAWFLHHIISEDAAIRMLTMVAMAGLRVKDIEAVSRAVLPKFYGEDIHPETWRVFSGCGARGRCVVTASPRIMVEFFCKHHLGADTVLGSELHVTPSGHATGLLRWPGALVGASKRLAVKNHFGDAQPGIGLGDRSSDLPFLALCKEAYIVPKKQVQQVPMQELFNPVVFHDGRLVQRPTQLVALLTLLWFPVGVLLALVRLWVCLLAPLDYVPLFYKLLGIKLTVKGEIPDNIERGSRKRAKGVLFVCCHRTVLDPVFLSVALGTRVTAVTYSVSRLTELLSPIPTVRLTRNRERDAASIKKLLEHGNLVICPEGTTCREPVLLRFSALFAELTDQIVPVAVLPRMTMFYGNTVRGYKAFDLFFFIMNPVPHYEITFLRQLPADRTHISGGVSSLEVANSIQKMLADTLGFQCTSYTRRDKYRILTGGDGSVKQQQQQINSERKAAA
ncbi:hypothetical protein KP509_1Z010700 [Ceratopteris richardii]|nr:hypothetical protein KP509_1Z010700 [Ceratopteris richardii]